MNNRKFIKLNSDRPQNRKDAELFCGWLKKQGGKFKSWKRRFFVLETNNLVYYSTEDKLRCLGSFDLRSYNLTITNVDNEVTSPTEERMFTFILKQESEQNTQIILATEKSNERKEWLRAIRKSLYLKLGGGIFGTSLSEIFHYSSSETKFIPRPVYDAVAFIRKFGISTDGIFRKCGSQVLIQELADAYDSALPSPIITPNTHDVHAISGLLKYYIRELPEPVIPYSNYDQLKATGYLIDDGQDISPATKILNSLPIPNYNLLQFLCQFLYEVSEHSDENRMTIENLASVFAPNILREAENDPDIEMAACSLITVTVASFIRFHKSLFQTQVLTSSEIESINKNWLGKGPASNKQFLKEVSQFKRQLNNRPYSLQINTSFDSGLSIGTDNLCQPPASYTDGQSCISRNISLCKKAVPEIPNTILIPKTSTQSQNLDNQLKSNSEHTHQASILNANNRTTQNYQFKLEASELIPGQNSTDNTADTLSETCTKFHLERNTLPLSINNEPADSNSDLTEQLRHWRSVALVARADAACERAKSHAMKTELSRVRNDLHMAQLEMNLLRNNLITNKQETGAVFLPTSTPFSISMSSFVSDNGERCLNPLKLN